MMHGPINIRAKYLSLLSQYNPICILPPCFNIELLYFLFCREGNATPDRPDATPSRDGLSPRTQQTRRQQAVCVRHAFKQYGSKKNPNHVLSNLNMTVAKGTM